MELIVPTPFLDEENTSSVRTSFFVDAANVWDTEFNIDRYQNLSTDERAKLDDYSDPMRFRGFNRSFFTMDLSDGSNADQFCVSIAKRRR